ncbi:low temperature requirement protein A [Herbiconiux moechotypicola]|uniref:Low temperature requirement protein A n=1 Tax=Herbiconiux moechotypicola TaxID=637393 RepID=A0ABN3DI57_9MICO|nr:low temperature requirement protein A [Herbiconiux moechotypicola]MCS5729707.1 low temperature requirement protein A [Herbiconiux moechotypicola]
MSTDRRPHALSGVVPLVRMRGRSIDEQERVSTPLELLFDLTFVVAVSSIVGQVAHAIEGDHLAEAVPNYLMVFFAIWWAWLNFTWFASAYDTDDVPYRLLTMLQMGGVLVLAAGVPGAFGEGDYTLITVGYFIMRIALVVQWLRAAAQDPSGRATALRYALGITVVQALWIVRLFVTAGLPFGVQVTVFVVLALLEMAVPPWAERTGETRWHPHHVAERYALFVIILLGESVLAVSVGVQEVVAAGAGSAPFVVLAASGLALLFGLWWVYFLQPAHEGLERNRRWAYFWGYGHYLVFAALAAVGAGLEVSVKAFAELGHESPSEEGHTLPLELVAFSIAVPVAVYLVMMWVLYRPLLGPTVIPPALSLGGASVVLALPLLVGPLPLPAVLLAIALTVAAVIAVTILLRRPRPAPEGP